MADYHTEAARLARMPWLVREVVRRRERDWARDASGFLAVSDPVADLVVRRWGVPRPTVLWNCPPAWRPDHPEPVASDRIRASTGIEPERPIVLYQGGFSVDRGVEELVAAATSPRLMELGAAVVFMGYGRLETHIADAAAAHPGRVYLLPAVRPDDLMPWTASADVCFVGQPPRTLNQRMNLPNKLFESIMAGVPVVVSEGNEQCRLTTAEKPRSLRGHRRPSRHRGRLCATCCRHRMTSGAPCAPTAVPWPWRATPGTTRPWVSWRSIASWLGRVKRRPAPSRGWPPDAHHGPPARLRSLGGRRGRHGRGARRLAGDSGDRTLVGSTQLQDRPFRSLVLVTVGERVVCTGFVVAPHQGRDRGPLPGA